MWMSAHQRPWTLGAIVAADHASLKASLRDRIVDGGYRRGWLVVGGDHGYWREERLCLRADGEWVLVIDGHRGVPGDPKPPPHPERIPAFEERIRELIVAGSLAEGTVHVARAPGLLLVGYDAETDAMYGLSGYRELLEMFWQIRLSRRVARGTDPSGIRRG